MCILITTDGSLPSRSVLPHAARFASACRQPVILLRVLNPLTDLGHEFAADVETATKRLREAWETDLAGRLAEAGLVGKATVEVLRHGEDVQGAILRAAQEQGATVIAMHSRGAGVLRHALLGSVAMGVLGQSRVPVLLAGSRIRAQGGEGGYHLVVTSDGSPASTDVITALAPVLRDSAAKVTLLRIYEPRSGRASPEAEQASCRVQLETLRPMLPAHLAVATRVEVCEQGESVAGAIVRSATGLGADAIATSTHGHGALRHLLAGSVALDVLERSPLPVVLARGA